MMIRKDEVYEEGYSVVEVSRLKNATMKNCHWALPVAELSLLSSILDSKCDDVDESGGWNRGLPSLLHWPGRVPSSKILRCRIARTL